MARKHSDAQFEKDVLAFNNYLVNKWGREFINIATPIFPNLPKGLFYGIATRKEAIALDLKRLTGKAAESGVGIYQLSNGYLIQHMDPHTFLNQVDEGGNIFVGSVREDAAKALEDSTKALHKFLEKAVPGTTYTIGIYNTNADNEVSVKGEDYPAFKSTIEELAAALGDEFLINVGEWQYLSTVAADPAQYLPSLSMAPSTNAVIAQIHYQG